MLTDDTVLIPLRARNGFIRAYAIIDAADAEWVNQWRWHLKKGYAARNGPHGNLPRDFFLLHRELLGLVKGDGIKGDHIDRNPLNCRRNNLRHGTHAMNMQNKSNYRGSRSQHRGVSWDAQRRKWQARIQVNGKMTHLGHFTSEDDAAKAAQAARLCLMPYATD